MKYFLFVLLLVLPFGLFAKTLEVGLPIHNLVIKDQFEKELPITAETKKIIISYTKAQGEIIKAYLEKHPNYLSENNALYFMDATSVPSMIMNLFMLPKFKKYSYAIGLLEEDEDIAYFPKRESMMTVISLENFVVKDIAFSEKIF